MSDDTTAPKHGCPKGTHPAPTSAARARVKDAVYSPDTRTAFRDLPDNLLIKAIGLAYSERMHLSLVDAMAQLADRMNKKRDGRPIHVAVAYSDEDARAGRWTQATTFAGADQHPLPEDGGL